MSGILSHWHIVALVVLGIYEVIIRLIPTVSSWSVLGLIIKILKVLSDYLDVKKK